MKVFVIGSGGREHAICWKLAQSSKVEKVFAAPGSDGISGENIQSISIEMNAHGELLQFAKEEGVDLTIVGPEAPLVEGIVDVFEKEGLRIFGPTKAAAALEGSKQFAKDIMKKYDIPTAAYETFGEIEEAKAYVKKMGAPIVIKADGLAAGKGVVVAENEEDALHAIDSMMREKTFGEAGSKLVIEECLRGEELSLMAFVHGNTVIPMVPAQDHKRAYDNDEGPNTGGMGAYSPVPHLENEWVDVAEKTVLRPMAEAMMKEGVPFTGVLYAGLMITEEGPKVIEFNVRFGDPETQVILPRMKSDLVDVLEHTLNGEEINITWTDQACVGVVLASEGYPSSYEKGRIVQIPRVDDHLQTWFHAGLKKEGDQWSTNGGRVLLLASLGTTIDEAIANTYEVLHNEKWKGLFYRKDIGHKVK
ncbi:phosphoribosylamine--glycine ligase [Bacillus shivajii]|uniref:phosphoribosylamine--glycine ligase n=1 Tax=Bacillus shivajii TaxID=1983719 RepID=UPI001CFBDD68|nr:phosphoribosylamine--glycine ligase [Bacillus shivajii]UCZ53795.1 phosphoribosylamine--glycine ligase [Bacillus shivajii]